MYEFVNLTNGIFLFTRIERKFYRCWLITINAIRFFVTEANFTFTAATPNLGFVELGDAGDMRFRLSTVFSIFVFVLSIVCYPLFTKTSVVMLPTKT